MKASEPNQSFGPSNRAASSSTPSLTAFNQLRKLLLIGSGFIAIVTTRLAYWGFTLGPSTALQLGAASLLTTLLLTVIALKLVQRRIRVPLSQLVAAIERVVEGHYDERSMIASKELAQVGASFNQLVTALVLAKEAMSDRDLLQQIIDGIPDPLVVLDGNGVVELSNRQFNEKLRFSDDFDVLGRGVGTLSGQNMPAWYMSLIRHGRLDSEPVDFKTPDGDKVNLLLSGSMIRTPHDRSSRVVLLARSHDSVEQSQSVLEGHGKTSTQSMAEFQNLFDAIEDPITVLALNGEILQANRAARSMFGKQVVGQKCFRAFRMRDSMCEQCPAKMTYEKKKSAFVEHRIFGNAITRINTYPLFDGDGEVRAIINHKRDVTMERQLEDLKANFLAGVSHELRTPLTSIIGFNKLNLKRMARHITPYLEAAPQNQTHAPTNNG